VLNFALIDHHGRLHELRRMGGKAVVLFFTANDCPVARQSAAKLKALRESFEERGVSILLVNSSLADTRKSISKEAAELGIWHLPVLKDDSQGVARHLGVKRTGETIAISTHDWTVFYRGAIDDQLVEGAQKPQPTEHYLENALNEFLDGKPIRQSKTVARGCILQFEGDKADAESVSYAQEVAPILQHKCVHCHSPGNIGSGAMSNYQKVKGRASMIEEVLLGRRMPPWGADPALGKFANDPSLSLSESQTLLRWIHQGAPRGEGDDPLEKLKTEPAPDWPLGPPDLVLRLPQPESIPATGVLDYRHIEVLAGNTNEAWVGGIWIKPGNRKVVHHVIARLKAGGVTDHLGQKEMFAGWAPGTTQGWLPKQTGKFLPANARFDFEVHYTPNGAAQTDQTELGLYLLPAKPASRFESVPVVNTTFEIKPGDPDSQVYATHCFTKAATLHSVTPHMHLRGRWMKFEALLPTGKREVICSVPRYDFNWQFTYVLEKPKRLPAGTWVMISGGYDNSANNPSNPDPKKAVHWGDQTFNEMFLGWYNVAWDIDPAPQTTASR
jgi:peroxiredoxin